MDRRCISFPAPDVSQPVETATEQPERCTLCGDTFQEHYPLGSQKVCYNKDPNKMAIITGNVFTAPVDAAQFESGLAPLLAEWEDANVQRVYSILNDELEHKSDEEHWEGYCARWIVGELIDPLNAEIERLKGLLREIEDEAYDRVDIDNEGRPNWAMRVHERIKAAVTGE